MAQQQEKVYQQRFSALIESDYDYERPQRGQVCSATVLSIDENEVIVDLGCKRDGIVPRTDLERLDDAYRDSLQVGEEVPVSVLVVSGRQGDLVVSLNQGLARQDWLRAQEMLESGETCEAEAVDVNRGGIIVEFGRLRGFVPNSQLNVVRPGMRGERLDRVKRDLVGSTLWLSVIEAQQQHQRLILSQRAAGARRRQEVLSELVEGEVRTGKVRNLVKFGAFVDLDGIDGLIHISELDWKHVDHPREVLSVGDEIDVYVLKVDRERERIGLSRRRLLPDPWPLVVDGLRTGQVVEGTVTNVATFGVFVDLGKGVEGLVHTSEIPREVGWKDFKSGSPLAVRVLDVDHWRRRIALSLRDVPATMSLTNVEAAPVLTGPEQPISVDGTGDVLEDLVDV
jgi:small subunit ribosomal protein S1